jgi:carbonic anhydrase/acetyltransferase-like protein (isoleucine patch superfamily)
MPIYALGEWEPEIADDAFIHPDAVIIGQVKIGSLSSVWPAAVIRGDWRLISIGDRTSIQDGAVIHVDRQQDTVIGSDCTVGHGAHAEGCTIGDGVLVGSRSAVLNGAVIGADSVVAAGCVVTPRTVVPERSIIMGVPGRISGSGSLEPGRSRGAVAAYIENGRRYLDSLRRID